MRIGILGGSFNPVHNGHLEIARNVLDSGIVENIWLLPSSFHPLKNHSICLSFEQRLHLLKDAVAGLPQCFVFDYDNQGDAPSFTAVLLQKLENRFPEIEFYFIIGYDIIPELNRWYNYPWLRDNARFIIINRPGNYDLSAADFLKNKQFVEMAPQDISSSEIRELVTTGKSINGLVPPQVEQEIISLYHNT
ncbi:MAG: nicotinate (nicotinamide) nucleotide adenylyltransferase [Candidatus Cloacimonetes bacterium]|nr:nicotinate (nicotinamide) nucleotide adenylyltransferase [Candidatus Cloacimonadota bacterium]